MRLARVASVIPWLVWVSMAATCIGYVLRYGPNFPFEDEFDELWLLEQDTLRVEWLVEPFSEHRVPLSLLVWWSELRAASWDFRAGMLVNVLLLTTLAAVLLVAVRRIRGAPAISDTFVPLVVLSLGQFDNLLWSLQVLFVLPPLLFGLFLASVLRMEGDGPPPLVASIAMALLPLADVSGLVLAMPLAGWVLAGALLRGRLRQPNWWPVIASAAFATGISVAFVVTFERPENIPPYELVAMLRGALEVMGGSLGPAFARFHLLWAGLVGLLALSAAHRVLRARLGGSSCPLREEGLLACLLASLALCLAIGLGRGVLGTGAGLNPKYSTLSATLPVVVYLIHVLHRGHREHVVPTVLFAAACLAQPAAIRAARQFGDIRRQGYDAFEADVAAGLTADALLARNRTTRYHEIWPDAFQWLETLHRHKVGPFGEHRAPLRRDSRPRAEVELELKPFFTNDVICRDGVAHVTGIDPYLVFRLDHPREVLAARVDFETGKGARTQTRLEAFWALSGTRRAEFSWWERSAAIGVPATSGEQRVEFPIYDTIDLLRFDPEASLPTFQLRRITLLVEAK